MTHEKKKCVTMKEIKKRPKIDQTLNVPSVKKGGGRGDTLTIFFSLRFDKTGVFFTFHSSCGNIAVTQIKKILPEMRHVVFCCSIP